MLAPGFPSRTPCFARRWRARGTRSSIRSRKGRTCTQITLRPPLPVIVIASFKVPTGIVHGNAAALVEALMAAAISLLRSTSFSTPPTVPAPLFEKVAPGANRTLPVMNSSPDIESLPLGPMQMSPKMPPGGPVMSTLAPPSWSTVHPVAEPKSGLAQSFGVPPGPQSQLRLHRGRLVAVCAASENGPGSVHNGANVGSEMVTFSRSASPVFVTMTL